MVKRNRCKFAIQPERIQPHIRFRGGLKAGDRLGRPNHFRLCTALIRCVLLTLLLVPRTQAAEVVVGINEGPAIKGSPTAQHIADQQKIIGELRANGVKVIRAGLYPGGDTPVNTVPQSVDVAARIDAAGIKILLLLNLIYTPGAPVSDAHSGALSAADVEQSKTYYQILLPALEAKNITLAGIELGNEFNGAGWNADFANFRVKTAFQHRLLGPKDLESTPEGRKISTGFLRYLEVLAALKEVRDNSKLNQHTPIISGGTASWNLPDDASYPSKTLPFDLVSPAATLTFLRAHGLDKLVDGYGLHVYPSNGDGHMDQRFAQYEAPLCGVSTAGEKLISPLIKGGKPCWFTEWGFHTVSACQPNGKSAPDAKQDAWIAQLRQNDFGPLARNGTLAGIVYYDWGDDWSGPTMGIYSVYRCGALTPGGHIALMPM